MVSDKSEQMQSKYLAGREALERGQYRLSVENLEAARDLVNPASRQGGEIQMWLVTAYQAVGRLSDAIALCRELTRHSSPKIRKQSQKVLYILEAPQLKRPPEWILKVPTVDASADNQTQYLNAKSTSTIPPKPSLKLEDASQINTQDNRFIWVALLLVLLILGGAVWLS